jgi:hypothetical protein
VHGSDMLPSYVSRPARHYRLPLPIHAISPHSIAALRNGKTAPHALYADHRAHFLAHRLAWQSPTKSSKPSLIVVLEIEVSREVIPHRLADFSAITERTSPIRWCTPLLSTDKHSHSPIR